MVPIAPRTSRPRNTLGTASAVRPNESPMGSGRNGGDLFPQVGVLLLVRGPDFVSRQLLEWLAIRHVDRHAALLQQFLGALFTVEAFGDPAHLFLCLTADVEQQFLLIRCQTVPDPKIERHQ